MSKGALVFTRMCLHILEYMNMHVDVYQCEQVCVGMHVNQ